MSDSSRPTDPLELEVSEAARTSIFTKNQSIRATF